MDLSGGLRAPGTGRVTGVAGRGVRGRAPGIARGGCRGSGGGARDRQPGRTLPLTLTLPVSPSAVLSGD